eukprot:XP_003725311.1 PREDICTED: uncharacterized protein LOC100889148 [Strongylocentrotus purpuratus]
MFVHMEKWRASPKQRYMPTTSISGSPSAQARQTWSSMPRWLRFLSIGFMILFVLPEKIQATVNMINQCGRTIHSAGDMIFSQGGLYYPPNINCTVTIATPSGDGRVLLQLHDSELMSDEDCSDDYLEISDIRARDDDGNDVDSRRICGTTSPMEVASQGSSLRIHLVSDGVGSGRGWSGVFTNVLPADGSLCLGYKKFLCSNGRCIPAVLRCDSVNHCGDNSDETVGCEDGLPYYLGDRVLELNETIYIGIAIAFTAVFVIYFAAVCTRDSCKQIKRRVKKLMTRDQEEDSEPEEEGLEAELRRALMATSLYDRRVSQPYDTTLNTITGGELARQLKLELRKIQENATDSEYHRPKSQASMQKSINYNYDKINSTSELIHLIDRDNNNHSEHGNDNIHFVDSPQSEHRVSFEYIPSVVVSEDGDESTTAVLYDPNEALSKGVPRNSVRGLYQKRLSRTSVSSIPEEEMPLKSAGAPTTVRNKIGTPSRFNVTAVSAEQLPSRSDGALTSDQNRNKSVSRFAVTTVPDDGLSKSGRDGTSVPVKSTTPSKPRFSVSKVPETEVQLPPQIQKSVSTPTTSRFSVTSIDENELKRKEASQTRRGSDIPGRDIPADKYLRVPSHRRSSAGVGKTVSSVSKQPTSRFSVQSVKDPLQDKQNDPKDNRLKNDSAGQTVIDSGIKSDVGEKSGKPVNPTPSRFTVQKVEEEPQDTVPKKLVSILKKFETLSDGTRSYTKQSYRPRFRRASEGATLDRPDDDADDLPTSAVTVHGYTSVKFWDEKRGRYSHATHL